MSYRYLYDFVNEEQKNLLQHNLLKPKAQTLLVELLENYGLEQSLLTARENGSKVQFLEAGCGDGHFLFDLADLLKEHNLLSAADLTGVDISETYLANANQKSKTNPNWAGINFYNVDITQPFEQNYTFKALKKLQFDCISATFVLQFLPNAHQHILNLYKYLKPGGVLYLCDAYMVYGVEKGWKGPNQQFDVFGTAATGMVRGLNGGKVIADEAAGWLWEAGAEQVQVFPNTIRAKGGDQTSVNALRYYIATVRSVLPVLRSLNLVSQEQQEEILAGVFKVSKDDEARLPFIHTLARKPQE